MEVGLARAVFQIKADGKLPPQPMPAAWHREEKISGLKTKLGM
jgi:hypothetical protein